MALLNINKKAGDQFSAEELNQIGRAIDNNTKGVETVNKLLDSGYVLYGIANSGAVPANQDKIFYFAMTGGVYENFNSVKVNEGLSILVKAPRKSWEAIDLQAGLHAAVEELMLGASDHIAAAWENDSTSEVAVQKVGKSGLVDWKMFLVDHTDNAGEWTTPVGVLQRNNLFRFEDNTFAPVVGITPEQKAECDIVLYRKVQGKLVKYCDAGKFNAAQFYNDFGIKELLYNEKGALVRILRPWETTETKYSIYLGYENKLYLIHNVVGNSGKLWEAIFTQSHSWDGINPIELLPTAFAPSGVYCIEEGGLMKTRCFFNLYSGIDKGGVHSAGMAGKGGICEMFRNGRTYPTSGGIQQILNMQWSRNNNADPKSNLPFAEGGFPYRDLFITYLEVLYGRKDLHNENFFGSGISSNASVSNEVSWLNGGGVRYKMSGTGSWKYGSFSSSPSDVFVDKKGGKGNWSEVLNGYYAKEQCMESQMAASWAIENNVPEGTHFEMYGGEYWWVNVPGTLGLLDGRMNARIYKIMKAQLSAFNSAGASILVDVEVILRMSLFEGAKLSGDIFQYCGGGYEVVGETLPTSKGGSTGEPVDIYLQPDQSMWHSETSTTKENKGRFDFEKNYFYLGRSTTKEGYAGRSVPFSNHPSKGGGGLTKGECYYVYAANYWGYNNPGSRNRIAQRFCGAAYDGACSPRYAHCANAVTRTHASFGGSAQVRLKHEPARTLQE